MTNPDEGSLGLVEKVAAAIRSAIDDSNQLASLKDVGEQYHGVDGLTLLYVDGAFDLKHVARAALDATPLVKLREALERLEAENAALRTCSCGKPISRDCPQCKRDWAS